MDLQNQLNLLPKPGSKVRVLLYKGLGDKILTEPPDGILETTVVSRQTWGGNSLHLSLADGWVFSPMTQGCFKGTFCAEVAPNDDKPKKLSIRAKIVILDKF